MSNELNVASVLTQLQDNNAQQEYIYILLLFLVFPNYDYDFNYLSCRIFPNKNNLSSG
jgi:hypothetical protein